MAAFGRAALYGLVVWLVPFVVAFAIFPLRESARPLFESIMPVAIAAGTVTLGVMYFRRVRVGLVREGLLLGGLWFAISVLIDAPLMLLGGPMQMSASQYVADIGVTYVMIPVITLGLGLVRHRADRAPPVL
ncbi:MAG: hypothetical protein OER21_16205 [Gemmatimonadota bacterium]|nr:hypothetical protein [Gemmatimonadota bacterium]